MAAIDENGQPEGLQMAVEGAVEEANRSEMTPEEAKFAKIEEDAVKKKWADYEQAQKFDKDHRAQIALDRRYAAGTADLTWRVTANLIGTFIDILVSFLYARNPDVAAKKNEQVDNRGTAMMDDFAKTVQIVVSSFWRRPLSFLKKNVRKQVRSTLAVGIGWIKGYLVCQGTNIPQLQSQLGDVRDNLSRLDAVRKEMAEQGPLYTGEMSEEQLNAKIAEVTALEKSVSSRLELAVRKNLATDYVNAEDIQVSLDVADVLDYLNAGWIAERFFVLKSDARARFPRLTEEDLKTARNYYQKSKRDLARVDETTALTGIVGLSAKGDEADRFTSETGGGTSDGDTNGPVFIKGIEMWCRNDGHVYTLIDGVKRYAKDPYQPDYPTSRFYPFFGLAFFPVDGERHPQSLTQRLRKLQDEYSATRSSERETRERSIPGIVIDGTNVPDTEVEKLQRARHQEITVIKPADPTKPIRDSFAEKPVASMDMRLFDTSSCKSDMERISGVQEALQSSVATPKTATEAEIQQSGFASRTTADRDVLEDMLSDYAVYTAEQALTALTNADAARIAGAKAFWPENMAVDDLLDMVEISIEAGTTGKPNEDADKEAWGVILSQLTNLQMQIRQAQVMGDIPLVNAMSEMLRETMSVLGVTTDPNRFIPQVPQVPVPSAATPAGADAPAGAPGDSSPPPGATASPDGSFGADLVPPELQEPVLNDPGLDEPPPVA